MRRLRAGGAYLAAAAACVALAGCGGAAATAAPPAAGPTAALPARCASRGPGSLPAETWPAARAELAPTGASSIRLCRYAGLNGPRRLALISSRLITNGSVVRSLVGAFDQLRRLPAGPVMCPMDDGSEIVARLAYPGDHSVTISAGLTGCATATNGSVTKTAAGSPGSPGLQLIARLKALVGGGS